MTSILSDTEFQAVVETIENDVLQEVMDMSVCDLICVLRDSDLTGILNAIVDKVVMTVSIMCQTKRSQLYERTRMARVYCAQADERE